MSPDFGLKSHPAVPAPANVRYNDWRQVALPPLERFAPSLPVSVVMPYYQTPAAVLARTLAALAGQTYPRQLFEVVIVDDGSEPPLELPLLSSMAYRGADDGMNIRVVRQERRGFGIARARNTGVRAAAHDIILFLDSDTLPESGWLAAHARWHHYVSDVLTVGLRAHVTMDDVAPESIRQRPGTLRELFAGRPIDAPWSEEYLRRTNDLRASADDLFRVVVGGNFGIGREFYWQAGGTDESFVRWGMEEAEFAYRAQIQGALLVPVREAYAWHQGRWDEDRAEKRRSNRMNLAKAANLIAVPDRFRPNAGRIYPVPRYVVSINAGDCPAEQVIATTASILSDRAYDLVARIEVSDNGDGERLALLQDAFGPEPRARVAPKGDALDEFPASPFHITLPATVTGKDLVHRLRARLGNAAIATASLPGGEVTIARAWALRRARRNGASPGDYGATRHIPPNRLKLKVAPPGRKSAGNPASYTRLVLRKRDILRERWRDIHSLREAWWLARWAALWCRRRLLLRKRRV